MTQPKEKHLRPVPVGGTVEPNTVAQAALRLLEHNISVLPVDPIHKNPKGMTTWTPLQETHLKPDEVLKYFRGRVSVAAICGAISEYLECLDFDCRSILFARFKEMVDARAPGLLDRLLAQKTQNEGRHLVYRVLFEPGYPAPGSRKLAHLALEVDGEPGSAWVYYGNPDESPARKEDVEKAGGKVAKPYTAIKGVDGKSYIVPTAIETKGEGGYFLVAPSAGYALLHGSFDNIPTITPEERQLLHDCAIELDEGTGVMAAVDDKPSKWRSHAREGEILPGDRFNSLASVPTILAEMGWQEAGPIRRNGRLGLIQYWTRPGKDSGTSGTYFVELGRFYSFTDNAPPLAQGETYDAFGLYVRHEHAGHFNTAAAHLMKEGIDGKWTADGESHDLDLTPTAEEREAVRSNILAAIMAVEDPKGVGLDILATDMVRRIAKSILSGPVKVALLGEIKKQSGVALPDLKAELKAAEKEAAEEAEKMPQIATLLAVLEAIGPDNIVFNEGCFRVWGVKPGVWTSLPRSDMEALVQNHIERLCPYNISSGYVRSITDLLRNKVAKTEDVFNLGDHLVNFQNGTLELDDDLCCWDFREARREDYLTVQLPVDYDPEAKAPLFEHFLDETFAGDQDAADKVQALLEFMGYCLLPTTKKEKFLMLLGVSGGGKSRIPIIMEGLLGRKNCSSVAPDQWSNRFQLAQLNGTLFNNMDELTQGYVLDDAALKRIVSGVSQTAEHKGQPPFNFRPFCRLIFTTNHNPHTKDFSKGVFRRALILEFNNAVPEEKRDDTLVNKILVEAPGVINLLVKAYLDVVWRGFFTNPESSRRLVDQWERQSNKAAAFIDECCEADEAVKYHVASFYAAFAKWSVDSGYKKTINKNTFSSQMKAIGHASVKSSKGQRFYKGLRIVGKYARVAAEAEASEQMENGEGFNCE